MTICMSKLLCVTNRTLCQGDFLQRIEALCAAGPAGIILREKDLSQQEYMDLARSVLAICRSYEVPCILHSFANAAITLGADQLHLPLHLLEKLSPQERAQFAVLGASCHSMQDAQKAQRLGCTYITAGHVFATDCKKGLAPRGLDFLQQVCSSVTIPVYAIGGIAPDKMEPVLQAGAKGACIMSSCMTCADVHAYFKEFEKAGEAHEI